MRTKITTLVVFLLVSIASYAKGSGTQADPYDVATACEIVKNLTWTSTNEYETTDDVYVKGRISSIVMTYTETGPYGNSSFLIKDDSGSAEFYCFRILYLGNEKFVEGQTDIKEGDEVIICGKLMNYRGNTPETVSGKAYLYSLNGISGIGTPAHPYNVAAACEAVKKLTWTSSTEYETTGNVYVKGRISWIANNGTFTETGIYGNASFLIKDDGGSAEFYCFRVLYLGNKKFVEGQTDIKEGDEVIVCGKLMNYRGSTPETVAGKAYLYSFNGTCGIGTAAHPYNVATACEIVKSLTWTSTTDYETTDDIYVKGRISWIANNGTFTETSPYGNSSFLIKDDNGSAEFYCFRILYLGNEKFVEGQTDIKEGDEVIICGKLMNYRGNTPETVSNKAYLYSLNGISGIGTAAHPYNVAATCEVVKKLTWTSTNEYETTGDVYVKGIISNIANNGTFTEGGPYGHASFSIMDYEGSVEFYCFRILYLGNKKFVEGQTDIIEGDEVIICGKLMNYRGNTPETVSNKAYLFSLNGIGGGITTGIDGVNRETTTNNRYYSLDGRRIDGKPTQKGVYINNGKKVVVK